MPRKANGRPPLSEWERQKDAILSLVSQHQWPVVIEKMEKDHDFFASNEHYVAQMKAWGARKYLKQHEWRGVLRRLDELSARHQRKIQVRFLGEAVPEDRIKKARKRCCLPSNPDVPSDNVLGGETPNSIPTHVSFEVLGAIGAWSTCANDLHHAESSPPVTLGRPYEFSSGSMQLPVDCHLVANDSEDDCATYTGWQLDPVSSAPINQGDGLTPALPFASASHGQDTNWPMWSPMPEFTLEPGLDIEDLWSLNLPEKTLRNDTRDLIQNTSATAKSSSMAFPEYSVALQTFDIDSLIHLPFQQFQMSVAIGGIDLGDLIPQKTAVQSYAVLSLAKAFLRDAADTQCSLSNMPGPWRSPHGIQPKDPLLSFHSLLPGEASGHRTDLITKDTMLDTNFARLLVFSITNGFAGLADIPVASILRFLTRYGNIDTLFARVLSASPKNVAKSLAENLVKVAIEARQAQVVKYLLDSHLLNINSLVCEATGEKLTAIERAAQLRDCKTVEVLLAAHADVHKSYTSIAMDRGPLNRLINGFFRSEMLSQNSDVMILVDHLLLHDAKIDVNMLEIVIDDLRDSTLALCLIPRFLETHDTDLIQDRILPLIALNLDEETAFTATEEIMRAFGHVHNGACLQADGAKVEWALVQSAKRGHVRVVQLLLPYTRTFHRALSASFHGGNSEIVNLILAKRPDLYAPAHSIDKEDLVIDDGEYSWTVTTPFAEAIRTSNSEWIHLCEASGTLQHLGLAGHFVAALNAAATIGDLQYVRKLIQNRVEPPPKEMHAALVLSIENRHVDISLLLLQAGAELQVPPLSLKRHSPLYAAVLQRNATLVRAILDAADTYLGPERIYSFRSDGLSRISIYGEIFKWGDRSILLDVHRAFPEQKMKYDAFSNMGGEVLNEGFIAFLMDNNLLRKNGLTRLLGVAIEANDIAMIHHLIDLGADPSNGTNLCLAIEPPLRPTLLTVLLDHIPKRVRRIPCLGTKALIEAIRLGTPGLNMVDVLLKSDVVDLHSCLRGGSPLGTAISKATEFSGDFFVVKHLLEAGCDPNSVVIENDDHNLTAILAAVQTKSVGLVQLLLDYGAEVNALAIRRLTRTPLQAAAESGCLEVVQLLLENGADVNGLPAQRGGGTALQFAAISGNCNIAAELLKGGADLMMPPSTLRGRWPLEGAAEHGRIDMLAFLLRQNVYNTDHCRRAAKFAEENGHMGCVDLIQEHISRSEEMPQLDAFELGGEIEWMV